MAGRFARWRQPAFIFGGLVVGLVAAFLAIVAWQSKLLIRERHEEFNAILSLKARALEAWVAHNEQDASVAAADKALRLSVKRVIDRPTLPDLRVLVLQIERLRHSFNDGALLVLDRRGLALAATGASALTTVSPDLRRAAVKVVRLGRPRWNYLHRAYHAADAPIVLDYLVPILEWQDKQHVTGVLVIRRAAKTEFFPSIQYWPTPSRSAETLLVRRSGKDVEFLNELRFRKDTALRFKIPMSNSTLPAVQALVANKPDVVDGRDYRGVEVIAFSRPIKGTDWVILSKVDRAEALGSVKRAAVAWIAAIGVLIALAMLGIAALSRQTRRLAAERERALGIERQTLLQRFKLLSRYSSDIVLLTNEYGYIVEANDKAVHRYGRPYEELIGLPLVKLRAPSAQAKTASDFERVMRDMNTPYETRHATAKGEEFPVEVVGFRVTEKNTVLIQFIIRDITERKAAELAVKRSEERFRALIEHATDLVVVLDGQGLLTYASPSVERVLGYKPSEVTHRSFIEFVHPDDSGAAQAHFAEVVAKPGAVLVSEFRYRHKDGRWIIMEVLVRSLLENASVGGIVVNGRDVTERRESERSLTLFRALIDRSSDAVEVVDPETLRYLDVNQTACEILGYSRDELLSMHVFDVDRELDPSALEGIEAQLRESGSAIVEASHQRKDGSRFPVEVRIRRVQMNDRQYNLVSAVDITERRKTDAALQESHRRLRTVVDRLPVGMVIAGEEGRTAELLNEAFSNITGYGIEEVPTFEDALQHLFPDPGEREDVRLEFQALVAEARRAKRPSAPKVYRMRHRDGSLRELEVQFVEVAGLGVWTFRDLTQQLRAERRVERLSMLKDALSSINRAIVRVDSEQTLFQRACDIAIERAGCACASIGLIEAGSRRVKVVACARGAGRDSCCSVGGDEPTSPEDFGSGASFALRKGAELTAVLTVYQAQVDAFDEETVTLFDEMAGDISFALSALSSERERAQAESYLIESEARFRSIVEQTISGVYIIGQDLRFIYVNPRLAEIFGYASNDEVINRPVADLVAPDARELVTTNLRRRLDGDVESVRYDFAGLRKDGSVVVIGAHGSAGTYQGTRVVIGSLQDVTEVRHAERQLREYVKRLEDTTENTIEIISVMGELRDPYTRGHERRVGELAAAIAAEMHLDEGTVEGLRVIGHLHDVGKIAVPAEILSKPTRLSPAEFELVKGHPEQGYDILKGYDFPWPVAQAVLQHHERLDGSGYPQGLKGDQIILEARILAVADTVEAMSSHRPYRPGLGLEAALKQIEGGIGKLYDPVVAAACLRLFREKGYQIPP